MQRIELYKKSAEVAVWGTQILLVANVEGETEQIGGGECKV